MRYWLNWPYWPEFVIAVGWVVLVMPIDTGRDFWNPMDMLTGIAIYFGGRLVSRSVLNKLRMRSAS